MFGVIGLINLGCAENYAPLKGRIKVASCERFGPLRLFSRDCGGKYYPSEAGIEPGWCEWFEHSKQYSTGARILKIMVQFEHVQIMPPVQSDQRDSCGTSATSRDQYHQSFCCQRYAFNHL